MRQETQKSESIGVSSDDVKEEGSKMRKTMYEAVVEFPDRSLRGQEEVDVDDQCSWLSADMSEFFEEYKLSNSVNASVDEWLVSWLSSTMASSHLSLNQENIIRPESNEKGLVKRETIAPEKDVIFQEQSSLMDAPIDSSSNLSNISDFDRASFLDSLVNLDGEDSKWISDNEVDLDYCFPPGFLSPSRKSNWDSETLSSPSSMSTVSTTNEMKSTSFQSDVSSESTELDDIDVDKPLFWPFKSKSDWNLNEIWEFLSMSPRRNIARGQAFWGKTSGQKCFGTPPKNVFKARCRRRLDFNSASGASKTLYRKQVNNHDQRLNMIKNSAPSRLRKSSPKCCAKIVPIGPEDKAKQAKGKNDRTQECNCVDGDRVPKPEASIETLLGLCEFDGHEGVDSEFNGNIFSLDNSI